MTTITSTRKKRSEILERISEYDEHIRKHMPLSCTLEFKKIANLISNVTDLIGANFDARIENVLTEAVSNAGEDELQDIDRLVFFAFMQTHGLNKTAPIASFDETLDTLTFNRSANNLEQKFFFGILNGYFKDFFEKNRKVEVVVEGLAEGVPNPMSDKFDKFGGDGNSLLAEIFSRADEIAASTLKGRPATGSEHPARSPVRARIDDDVIDWLKAKNPQYTTQINAVLRALKEAEEDMFIPAVD
ncbi:MAG: BrnA antitoxin family protein [Rhizobiaceae bacterium]|nr:BrnA antitoxin family protein [Rhizobiaceae bacterium]